MRAFERGLLSTPWPAPAASTAQKLAESIALDTVAYLRLARAKTKSQWDEAVSSFSSDPDGGKYAELIRTQLGLPSAPS